MPKPLEIKIDLSEIMAFAESTEQAGKIAVDEIATVMDKGLAVMEEAIAVRTPVGVTGNLRGSIATETYRRGMSVFGEVFTPLKYGEPVERGRRAGKWPPQNAIKLWVVRKLDVSAEEADQVAFLVARAIGRGTTKGIMKKGGGAKMFEEGFDYAEPIVVRFFDDVPGNILDKLRRLQ